MAKKPYMDSTELLKAVKSSISFPLTQVTFSDEEILDFATQELFLSQVPSVMQYHEEFFVTDMIVPLVDNISKYDIPNRAIGMKLRDLFYIDTNGNQIEMVNVGPSNSDIYRNGNTGSQTPRHFYMQGNEVVLVPDNKTTTGSLLMKYYIRPNSLVVNERAAISNSIVKIITISNDDLVSGDTITIGGVVLTAGTEFAIGATSTATAANLATAANALTGITSSSTGPDVSIFYQALSKTFSTSNTDGFIIDTQVGLRCNSIPENFQDGMLVDILQTAGGHNTLSFDVTMGENSVSSDTLFFDAGVIPAKFVVGDYICEQHECIIPQIPSDLHMLLVQRTCSRILGALGDNEGAASSMSKINDLEARQAVLIDNRTEGAPRKIFNRHSLLRYGKSRRIGRN